ncbi:carboxymuconolactone decarboxylase family protein [Microbacterium yannicii]|uniref:carboxymuconolactone decarboxylase family protein n=1 Tax=Microbacterium yannicii TaxID=671622 RepID=UPI0002F2BFFF|nr:carboxymuconolactone decarboxylase family protein [Microbacterium yannicii]
MTATYRDRLRQLAISDTLLADAGTADDSPHLDAKTVALARLSALIAVGGPDPSFGEHVDAAISAGAGADEIVDVLVGVRLVVGAPRVVAAAPQIALALGYDLEATDL